MADELQQTTDFFKSASYLSQRCGCSLVFCKLVNTAVGLQLTPAGNDDPLQDDHDGTSFYLDAPASTSGYKANEDFPADTIFLELEGFTMSDIKSLVVKHNIWLILVKKNTIQQLRSRRGKGNTWLNLDKINCPVLMIPEHFDCRFISKIAYATDLRYCDYCIIRFLKVFNSAIFLIHLTAPGLVDMDDQYAKDLVKNEISLKSNCKQLFLFNVRGKEIAESMDGYLELSDFQMLAFFSGNQSVSDRVFGEESDNIQNYHDLPFLIFPYLNWFQNTSFYEAS